MPPRRAPRFPTPRRRISETQSPAPHSSSRTGARSRSPANAEFLGAVSTSFRRDYKKYRGICGTIGEDEILRGEGSGGNGGTGEEQVYIHGVVVHMPALVWWQMLG